MGAGQPPLTDPINMICPLLLKKIRILFYLTQNFFDVPYHVHLTSQVVYIQFYLLYNLFHNGMNLGS